MEILSIQTKTQTTHVVIVIITKILCRLKIIYFISTWNK